MHAWKMALPLSALTLMASPALAADHEGWIQDWDEAVKVARAEGKDLFVDFTGSDWCGWCIRLKQEVFEHEEFLNTIRKDYVLVMLDFPRGEEVQAKVPNPERNDELSQRYRVNGFPTILLATPEGEVFGRTGYQPGGPSAYLEHVDELRKDGLAKLSKVKELNARFAEAEGEQRIKVWEESIAMMTAEDAGSDFAALLADNVRTAFRDDPENKAGRKARAVKALVDVGLIDVDVFKAVRELDPRNEGGLLLRAVEALCQTVASEEDVEKAVEAIDLLAKATVFEDKEAAVMVFVNGAFWSDRVLEDSERAKRFAQHARDLGTEDPQINEMLDSILDA